MPHGKLKLTVRVFLAGEKAALKKTLLRTDSFSKGPLQKLPATYLSALTPSLLPYWAITRHAWGLQCIALLL